MKTSFKCLSLDFSTASATTEKPLLGLNASRVEIQVDWTGLTGTLDGTVNILQRSNPAMSFNLVDALELSASLNSAPGSKTFTFWQWAGSDITIQVLKNSLTGGTLTAAVNITR